MRKSPRYDSQRSELYQMEHKGLFGLNRTRTTREEHRKLMALVCRKARVHQPTLRYAKAKGWAGMYHNEVDGSRPVITLSTVYNGGLSPMALIHELTHYLMDCADPKDILASHGPEFVGVYGDLMECLGYVPFGSWRMLTAQFGVKCYDTRNLELPPLLIELKKRAAEAAPKSPPT